MKNKMSRRVFLQGGTAVLVTTTIAACGVDSAALSEAWATATPARVLQSPMPPGTPEPTGTLSPDTRALENFLALSAVLTGVPNLNPAEGQLYLQSLSSNTDLSVTVSELYAQAGFASRETEITLADLEAADLFNQEETRKVADKIIEHWYTGTYTNAEGDTAVATYVDALAWKVLAYTKPTTICGQPYFWASRPNV